MPTREHSLREFLEIPYDPLEEMNLAVKKAREAHEPIEKLREERLHYLKNEGRIKAVTVCFTDLEGRLQMLDYDKKYLLTSENNLTFDGSSVRGFSSQQESDLRLVIDWSAFYWLPADVFGPGKVLVFSEVYDRDGTPYPGDMRGRLRAYGNALRQKNGTLCMVAPEIEGFLFRGRDVERHYHETGHFELVSTGGYYHSLPGDPLRQFMDSAAEVQRAMGFGNEKDHPEVAPSQFEMNFACAEAIITADQVQLYKLLCKQVASNLDQTACFLPKPVAGVNGTGMHINLSLSKDGTNLFWDANGKEHLSRVAWQGIEHLLRVAKDLCLVLNPSVNAYRRLDPRYEAPNQIKVSANDRTAMIRIPTCHEDSARLEVRSVAADTNPYLVFYTLMRTMLEVPEERHNTERAGSDAAPHDGNEVRVLQSNIQEALLDFRASPWMKKILGEDVVKKFADIKQAQADRCPKLLGERIKVPEIQYHHEVTNQYLWGLF